MQRCRVDPSIYLYWKNLMVISGGTFSIALCISWAAFASRFVSMLIPTPHPLQRMRSASLDSRSSAQARDRTSGTEIGSQARRSRSFWSSSEGKRRLRQRSYGSGGNEKARQSRRAFDISTKTSSLLLLFAGLGGRLVTLILLGCRGGSARRRGLRGFRVTYRPTTHGCRRMLGLYWRATAIA
jgi:hypothetical protein